MNYLLQNIETICGHACVTYNTNIWCIGNKTAFIQLLSVEKTWISQAAKLHLTNSVIIQNYLFFVKKNQILAYSKYVCDRLNSLILIDIKLTVCVSIYLYSLNIIDLDVLNSLPLTIIGQ